MPIADVNGIEIAYEVQGKDGGPAVMMVMGLGGQLVMWPQELIDQIVSCGYRVVLLDNRDIGLSSKFSGHDTPNPIAQIIKRRLFLPGGAPYDLSDMVQDTLGLADHLELRHFHIIGVSMGGMIAQILAAKHPARVDSVTVISSTTNNPFLPVADMSVGRKLREIRPADASKDEAIKASLEGFALFGTPGEDHNNNGTKERLELAYDRNYCPDCRGRQLAAILETGNFCWSTRRIKAPTLVIHGTKDPLIPIQGSRDVARCAPSSRLVEIEGMGHDLPGRFMEQIGAEITGHLTAAD